MTFKSAAIAAAAVWILDGLAMAYVAGVFDRFRKGGQS